MRALGGKLSGAPNSSMQDAGSVIRKNNPKQACYERRDQSKEHQPFFYRLQTWCLMMEKSETVRM